MSLNARNGIDLHSVGQIANIPDPTTAQQAATKNYVDTTGLGRQGSYQDTSASSGTGAGALPRGTGGTAGTEVKIGQFTFTAVAGRRYRLVLSGPQNNGTGRAMMLQAGWHTGTSVTVANRAVLFQVPNSTANGFTNMTCGEYEIAPNVLTAGTVAIGVFVQQTVGNGTDYSQWGNGATQPTLIYIDDVGT